MPDVEQEGLGLRARLIAHWRAKLAVSLGLAVGICVPYFTIQRIPGFAPRSVPEIGIDRWIPFEPGFIWAYLSIAALVPLAPALAVRRDALRRYAFGLCLLCVPCFVVFALFPVHGPRPEAAPDHWLYAWIVNLDRPSNSMPSLHAGLVVYSLLFALRALEEGLSRRAQRRVALAGCVWAGLILYSTLATKQHWALDLPAGGLLAWGAHALAWRGAREAPPGGR